MAFGVGGAKPPVIPVWNVVYKRVVGNYNGMSMYHSEALKYTLQRA